MKWSENYASGIERIDEQHKMLFKMSEDFAEALDHGKGERVYASFLDSLNLYAATHFRFEEGCMERCQCPVATGNKTAHDQFMATLTRHTEHFSRMGYSADEARALTQLINTWLADHIGRIDVKLRDWVTPGTAPDGRM